MEPPAFGAGPAGTVRAAPGSPACLLLPLPTGTPPFLFTWSRGGATLDDRFTSSTDAAGVRLSVSAARTGDSGVYTLQASNAAGSDTSRVRLEVSAEETPTGEDPPTFLRRLQDLTVKVGTRTRFLVEIISSTECKVTWYRNERRLLEAERVSLARDGNFWCADVGAVSVDDAGRWTCTAENEGGRASCSAHLNVLVPKAYKRPEFVEELRALLTEQGTVSLECKVVGVPTPVLRWFKDSREIKAGDVFALTANADDPTSLGTYTCEAVNCMGRAYSSSKVHVVGRASRETSIKPSTSDVSPEPPPIFTKELEDHSIKICDSLTLSCHVVVPPWPRSVVWYNKEGKVEPGDRYHALEDGVGGYLLEIPSAEWADEGEWKCVATSTGGRVGICTCYVAMEVPKNYRKPRFMENLQAVLTEEGLVSFECKVVGFPTPVLSWFKDGQELKPGDVYQLTGTNSLGSYCCIARNCMGQASSSAELTVEDIQNQLNEEEKLQLFSKNQAPKFIQGLKSVEAKIDEPFRFTVKVGVPPEPSVVWYRDEQPVDESTRCHLGQEERGVFCLHIQTLEFLDQAEWKCVALNDFGHSVTSCFLKLIIPRHYKKPRFLENLQAILSEEGAVNLECKVIGVPQPILKWYKDGEELKPGDIHRIISGQDGTCCLGTYTCEAQNCMGIAASSASLLGFEDSMKAKAKKAEEQALQRNLSLSTIHEERTSQMYDTPVGDITLDDKGEISFSFDGKEVSVSLYETPDLTEEEALQIVEMYADQLSENVTEHNVVELPPLRFVKETSTSGNLLMEAIIIDVSPDYFASPEEDLRTEADVEDISIADENGPLLLSLDQDIEIAGEDYLEKTMALLSEEKSDIPAKVSRKKSDSQKSVDDFYSLSRDQSLSEEREKRDDDTHISESDLVSYESARSSAKVKSKSSKPSTAEGQKSSELTKTILHKDEPVQFKEGSFEKTEITKQLQQVLEVPAKTKMRRERRMSRGSRRSSSGSDKSISKSKEDIMLLKADIEQPDLKPAMRADDFAAKMCNISETLSKVINEVQMIERDIILKSELMSSAATASRSLEIISTLINPLSEIQSIADAAKESAGESKEETTTIFNSLPKALKSLHQSLTIVEKCIDMESDNKTLVKKTCIAFIETCGEMIQKIISEITSVAAANYLQIDNRTVNEIDSLASEMSTAIKFSTDTIQAGNLLSEATEVQPQEPSIEENHVKNTQKAVFELKSPVYSLLNIIESAEKGKMIELSKVPKNDVLLNDMSAPIQDLQMALEHVESLSMKESTSTLQKYNTEIIEAVVEPILKLRSAFEQLSTENSTCDNIQTLKEVLLSIKQNLNEVSCQINTTEEKIGKFEVLQSDNKLNILQKMAQSLITLENNLPRLETMPEVQTNINAFHKNLTKVLEIVIETNDAEKYSTLMEICDAVNRINTFIKDIDPENALPLASFSNTLRIIQELFVKNMFEYELNYSIITGITDLLVRIQEAINKAEELSLQIESEHIQDLVTSEPSAVNVTVVMERIDQTIAAIDTIKTIDSTQELKMVLSPTLENICPILEDLKKKVAAFQQSEEKRQENITDFLVPSIAEALATPLCELNQNIIVLNQLLVENIESLKSNSEVTSAVAEPLHELHTTLEILQQDVISQYEDDMTPYEVNVNMASAVQKLHSCIVMIQEQAGLEGIDEISTLEDISNLKTSAEPLPSDRLVLPAAEETKIEQSLLPFITKVPVSATAQALQSLNEHLIVMQTPEIVDALDTLSEVSDFSSLKSVVLGMEELHNGIESILHPLAIETSDDLGVSTNFAVIAQPLQELQQSLSVLDPTNIPIHEDILDLSTEKVHSVIRAISEFKKQLNMCNQAVLPAVDVLNNTFEISTAVSNLRNICSKLKDIIEKAKVDSDDITTTKIEKVEEVVENLVQVTNVTSGIKLNQIRFIAEELFEKVSSVQEELIHFTSQPSITLAHEAKLIEIVEEVENNIAVLQQYDFVDLSRVSDMSPCLSPDIAMEIESDSLALMAGIVENAVNVVQDFDQDTPVADMMIVEKFLKTCKNEFTILKCLISKATSHKKIIRLLGEFKSLQTMLIDFKSTRSELQLSDDISGCLGTFLAHADDCTENIQGLLVKIVASQSEVLIQTPVAKILAIETLKDSLKCNENSLTVSVIDKILNIFETVQPLTFDIENNIIQSLKQPIKPSVTCEECIVTEQIDKLLEYIEAQSKSSLTKAGSIDMAKKLSSCIYKHQEFKGVSGNTRTLIILKCLSECVDILCERNTEEMHDSEPTTFKESQSTLKEVLTEMLQPLEELNNHLLNIREQVSLGMEDDSFSYDITATESLIQTMTELHNNVARQIESEDAPINNEDIALIMDVDHAIHSLQDRIQSLEGMEAAQAIMEITKPVDDIKKSLRHVLNTDKGSQDGQMLDKENSADLLQHIDQYIELIEIVEEISAIIKIENVEETFETARELKESIASFQSSIEGEINKKTSSDQTRLALKLQRALSTLQVQVLDSAQELAPALSAEALQRIAQVTAQLQADLVAVTGAQVTVQAPLPDVEIYTPEKITVDTPTFELVVPGIVADKKELTVLEQVGIVVETETNVEHLVTSSEVLEKVIVENSQVTSLADTLSIENVEKENSLVQQTSPALQPAVIEQPEIVQGTSESLSSSVIKSEEITAIEADALAFAKKVTQPVVKEESAIVECIIYPKQDTESNVEDVKHKLIQEIEDFVSSEVVIKLSTCTDLVKLKNGITVAQKLSTAIASGEAISTNESVSQSTAEVLSYQANLAQELKNTVLFLLEQGIENLQAFVPEVNKESLEKIIELAYILCSDLGVIIGINPKIRESTEPLITEKPEEPKEPENEETSDAIVVENENYDLSNITKTDSIQETEISAQIINTALLDTMLQSVSDIQPTDNIIKDKVMVSTEIQQSGLVLTTEDVIDTDVTTTSVSAIVTEIAVEQTTVALITETEQLEYVTNLDNEKLFHAVVTETDEQVPISSSVIQSKISVKESIVDDNSVAFKEETTGTITADKGVKEVLFAVDVVSSPMKSAIKQPDTVVNILRETLIQNIDEFLSDDIHHLVVDILNVNILEKSVRLAQQLRYSLTIPNTKINYDTDNNNIYSEECVTLINELQHTLNENVFFIMEHVVNCELQEKEILAKKSIILSQLLEVLAMAVLPKTHKQIAISENKKHTEIDGLKFEPTEEPASSNQTTFNKEDVVTVIRTMDEFIDSPDDYYHETDNILKESLIRELHNPLQENTNIFEEYFDSPTSADAIPSLELLAAEVVEISTLEHVDNTKNNQTLKDNLTNDIKFSIEGNYSKFENKVNLIEKACEIVETLKEKDAKEIEIAFFKEDIRPLQNKDVPCAANITEVSEGLVGGKLKKKSCKENAQNNVNKSAKNEEGEILVETLTDIDDKFKSTVIDNVPINFGIVQNNDDKVIDDDFESQILEASISKLSVSPVIVKTDISEDFKATTSDLENIRYCKDKAKTQHISTIKLCPAKELAIPLNECLKDIACFEDTISTVSNQDRTAQMLPVSTAAETFTTFEEASAFTVKQESGILDQENITENMADSCADESQNLVITPGIAEKTETGLVNTIQSQYKLIDKEITGVTDVSALVNKETDVVLENLQTLPAEKPVIIVTEKVVPKLNEIDNSAAEIENILKVSINKNLSESKDESDTVECQNILDETTINKIKVFQNETTSTDDENVLYSKDHRQAVIGSTFAAATQNIIIFSTEVANIVENEDLISKETNAVSKDVLGPQDNNIASDDNYSHLSLISKCIYDESQITANETVQVDVKYNNISKSEIHKLVEPSLGIISALGQPPIVDVYAECIASNTSALNIEQNDKFVKEAPKTALKDLENADINKKDSLATTEFEELKPSIKQIESQETQIDLSVQCQTIQFTGEIINSESRDDFVTEIKVVPKTIKITLNNGIFTKENEGPVATEIFSDQNYKKDVSRLADPSRLVTHIEDFVADNNVQEITNVTSIEAMKESVSIAKKLRDCILSHGYSATVEETSPLTLSNHSEEVKLIRQLQNALSVLHTQALDSTGSIMPLIKPESLQKVSDVITLLQEDLASAVESHIYELVHIVELPEKTKQETLNHLQTLLHDINKAVIDATSSNNVENTEALKDSLEEVQTVIIKLKRDYDGAVNDSLCETLDDLECSVRSVQLQINEESSPELLKEACETLQLLANSMTTAQDMFENVICPPTQTILDKCTNETDGTLKLIEKACIFEPKDNSSLCNIISNLNGLTNCLKSLRRNFLGDADTLIENGIEVIQCLGKLEDQVFDLEKEIDAEQTLSPNKRDSILTAVHSVYGSISNMRGTILSIQKRFMFENYGQPSELLLRSIKNVANIIAENEDLHISDWKKFSKSIRNALNHFEDIKFYINLDKTARIPSDSTFTKIILGDLKTNISNVLMPQGMRLGTNILELVCKSLKCVDENLGKIQDQTSLEVKYKIPIFKNVATEVYFITNVVKSALKEFKRITEEPLSKQQELDVNVAMNLKTSDILNDVFEKAEIIEPVKESHPLDDTFTNLATQKYIELQDTEIDSLTTDMAILKEVLKTKNQDITDIQETEKMQSAKLLEKDVTDQADKSQFEETLTETVITVLDLKQRQDDEASAESQGKIKVEKTKQDVLQTEIEMATKINKQEEVTKNECKELTDQTMRQELVPETEIKVHQADMKPLMAEGTEERVEFQDEEKKREESYTEKQTLEKTKQESEVHAQNLTEKENKKSKKELQSKEKEDNVEHYPVKEKKQTDKLNTKIETELYEEISKDYEAAAENTQNDITETKEEDLNENKTEKLVVKSRQKESKQTKEITAEEIQKTDKGTEEEKLKKDEEQMAKAMGEDKQQMAEEKQKEASLIKKENEEEKIKATENKQTAQKDKPKAEKGKKEEELLDKQEAQANKVTESIQKEQETQNTTEEEKLRDVIKAQLKRNNSLKQTMGAKHKNTIDEENPDELAVEIIQNTETGKKEDDLKINKEENATKNIKHKQQKTEPETLSKQEDFVKKETEKEKVKHDKLEANQGTKSEEEKENELKQNKEKSKYEAELKENLKQIEVFEVEIDTKQKKEKSKANEAYAMKTEKEKEEKKENAKEDQEKKAAEKEQLEIVRKDVELWKKEEAEVKKETELEQEEDKKLKAEKKKIEAEIEKQKQAVTVETEFKERKEENVAYETAVKRIQNAEKENNEDDTYNPEIEAAKKEAEVVKTKTEQEIKEILVKHIGKGAKAIQATEKENSEAEKVKEEAKKEATEATNKTELKLKEEILYIHGADEVTEKETKLKEKEEHVVKTKIETKSKQKEEFEVKEEEMAIKAAENKNQKIKDAKKEIEKHNLKAEEPCKKTDLNEIQEAEAKETSILKEKEETQHKSEKKTLNADKASKEKEKQGVQNKTELIQKEVDKIANKEAAEDMIFQMSENQTTKNELKKEEDEKVKKEKEDAEIKKQTTKEALSKENEKKEEVIKITEEKQLKKEIDKQDAELKKKRVEEANKENKIEKEESETLSKRKEKEDQEKEAAEKKQFQAEVAKKDAELKEKQDAEAKKKSKIKQDEEKLEADKEKLEAQKAIKIKEETKKEALTKEKEKEEDERNTAEKEQLKNEIAEKDAELKEKQEEKANKEIKIKQNQEKLEFDKDKLKAQKANNEEEEAETKIKVSSKQIEKEDQEKEAAEKKQFQAEVAKKDAKLKEKQDAEAKKKTEIKQNEERLEADKEKLEAQKAIKIKEETKKEALTKEKEKKEDERNAAEKEKAIKIKEETKKEALTKEKEKKEDERNAAEKEQFKNEIAVKDAELKEKQEEANKETKIKQNGEKLELKAQKAKKEKEESETRREVLSKQKEDQEKETAKKKLFEAEVTENAKLKVNQEAEAKKKSEMKKNEEKLKADKEKLEAQKTIKIKEEALTEEKEKEEDARKAAEKEKLKNEIDKKDEELKEKQGEEAFKKKEKEKKDQEKEAGKKKQFEAEVAEKDTELKEKQDAEAKKKSKIKQDEEKLEADKEKLEAQKAIKIKEETKKEALTKEKEKEEDERNTAEKEQLKNEIAEKDAELKEKQEEEANKEIKIKLNQEKLELDKDKLKAQKANNEEEEAETRIKASSKQREKEDQEKEAAKKIQFVAEVAEKDAELKEKQESEAKKKALINQNEERLEADKEKLKDQKATEASTKEKVKGEEGKKAAEKEQLKNEIAEKDAKLKEKQEEEAYKEIEIKQNEEKLEADNEKLKAQEAKKDKEKSETRREDLLKQKEKEDQEKKAADKKQFQSEVAKKDAELKENQEAEAKKIAEIKQNEEKLKADKEKLEAQKAIKIKEEALTEEKKKEKDAREAAENKHLENEIDKKDAELKEKQEKKAYKETEIKQNEEKFEADKEKIKAHKAKKEKKETETRREALSKQEKKENQEKEAAKKIQFVAEVAEKDAELKEKQGAEAKKITGIKQKQEKLAEKKPKAEKEEEARKEALSNQKETGDQAKKAAEKEQFKVEIAKNDENLKQKQETEAKVKTELRLNEQDEKTNEERIQTAHNHHRKEKSIKCENGNQDKYGDIQSTFINVASTESLQRKPTDSDQHYTKEYQYEPTHTRINQDTKEKPRFVDRNHRDYTMEFARPPGYRERSFDVDRTTENQLIRQELGKNASIYKAQTIVLDAQLRSSTSPYSNTSKFNEPNQRKQEIRQRSKALSEARSIVSEKRSGISRDSKRKPVFSTYLTDRTVVEGSRVKLTCSVLSSSDPTITWYRNGILLDNKLKYRTKYVDGLITLEVLNAVTSDSAEYSCSVENDNGSVSSSAKLKVYPSFEASPIPPTFTRSIRDTYHMAENELVLECRIRGQPLPTITWLKDDRPIVSNERFQAYYLADGVCRLAIESPTPDDSGKYTCKAENSVWSDQITHIVTFTGKERRLSPNIATIEKSRFNRQAMESRRPHFTNVLTDYKVSKGGTIGLQVEIRGAPTSVEWLREGRSVTELYRNAKTFVEQGLYTLALTDVTEKESGTYTCRAWSSHGNVDMNAAITVVQLNEVEGKPAIILGRPEKDILISVGEDVNISFRVQGEPKPKVIFMKGIRDITTSQRVCKMTSDDYVKFTLKRSVISDAGTYCILARNAYGCDRAFVTVVVRQRASSDNLISDWTYPTDETSMSTTERNYKSVPERIPAEPTVVDGGSNWVSLSWPKPEPGVSAPVLAFRIESWLLGKEGGARWVELGITPLNSFEAFNLKQGEEYHFRVTPRNRYGWGESVQTSRPVAIGITGDRPEFVDILPGQLKVLAGETANLCCSVTGKPTPEVVWMKNGLEIEEESERVSVAYNGYDCGLTIKDICIEDEARYSCEATNVHGRTSTYARLAVVTDRMIWEADAKLKRERSAGAEGEFPPQFTMRLRDRRVQATYPVRLTCQVIGSPTPTLTWYKDGQELESDSRRCQSQDEHFHTLEIAPTALEDGGVYEALARNSRGAVSCRCSLIVDKGIRAYVAPEFCCGLEPLYRLSDGEELRISAVVEAYPSVGVTWYRDGVRLRPSRRAVMTLDHDGQIELALAAVTPRDAGVYTCTASNEVGRASTSGKVDVIGGETETKIPPPVLLSPDVPYSKEPMFIRKPRSSSAREGDTVIIQCEVVGDPKPDVYWLRDFLKPDYYRDASHFRRVGLGPEYRFEIPHAKLDYTGAYSVVARNVHGEAKAVISLQILAKDLTCTDEAHNIRYGEVEVLPRFEKELTDLLSCDGDAVEFECRVSGHPEPDVRWFHYNELIRESEDFEWTFEEGSARLRIRQVTAEDEGTYTCEAANSLGKAASSACLVVYPAGEPNTLCQRLRRPPALLSAASTPRSTPRTTPARSISRARTPGPDTRRLCSPTRQMAPAFYTYPFNKVAEEGDTVTLQCAVKGLPAPWATWDKDGVIITPSSRITIKEKDEILRILEIEHVTVDDVGVYRITVENEFGRAEASARIEVITQRGKFYGGVRAISPSPRRSLTYRSRRPSTPRQD